MLYEALAMRYLTYDVLVGINKRLNEYEGKKQTNFKKETIRSIAKEAYEMPPIAAATTYYYRIIYEHPFRGANRRTAFIATDMFLRWHAKKITEISIADVQSTSQKIRDGRLSREAFSKIFLTWIVDLDER